MTCNVDNTYSDSFVLQKMIYWHASIPIPLPYLELTEKEFCVFSAAIPQ